MDEEESLQPQQKLSSKRRRRALRVLVVNDFKDTVESMAMLLRLHGHEVQMALGGAEALRTARAYQPDVVLLDIAMPGMDGCQVARELRAMLQDRVRLIAITAHGFDEDIRRCREAGFDKHFVKPADPRKVCDILWEVATSL
jgi:CheY-like chemotaxis protein